MFTATSIVVANMIGAGIFTTSGLMAGHLSGSAWILLFWALGGLIALSGALSYAELATRMPEEGGEYVYLKKLFHPLLGFLTGWTSFFVGFTVPIAASALGFAEYLFAGLNIPEAAGLPAILLKKVTAIGVILIWKHPAICLLIGLSLKKAIAVGIILIFTTIHYTGLRVGSRVQNLLTVLKIVIVLGLAAAGLMLSTGSWGNITFFSGDVSGGSSFGTAMILVMFSYSGWNASAYIAGELKSPRKTLPLSLAGGTLLVMSLYLLINIFVVRSVPMAELKQTITVVEIASVKAFGPWIGDIMGILVACALLSSLSAFIIIGPRVYFAMARDRLFPSFAAAVSPRFGVPSRAILIQGTIAVLAVIVGSFEQLLIYVGYALNIFPWLAIFGIFIARRRNIGDESAVKVWGYPLVPLFYLVSSFLLAVIAYVNRPFESSAALVTVALGVPCYFLWTRKSFRGE